MTTGALLAAVTSPEIAEAVNAERLAKQTLERERRLYAQSISSQKDLQAAEAAYETARQKLGALGFTDTQVGPAEGKRGSAAL